MWHRIKFRLSSGPCSRRKTLEYWNGAKGYESGREMEVSDRWGEVERDKSVQPGAENICLGHSYQWVSVPEWGTVEDRPRLLSVMPTNRTRVNGHKLNYRGFCLKTNKTIIFYCKQKHNFFIARMVEQVLWEGCGVSVWRYSKQNWTWPWAICSR